ncbi:MAG: hypothetical protein AMS22_09400 [Thiotrichales bacterium SG8_50]|nr:MAG: hypothetical protein AMS22_09400 [Thiotrichales bacterium SG8_50]
MGSSRNCASGPQGQDGIAFDFMDHPVMEALGMADNPSILMGNDQLVGRKLTICLQIGTALIQ